MGVFKKLAEYLYLKKKDPDEPQSDWLGYMHGINRISLLMFIGALLFIIIKFFIMPLFK